MQNKLAVFDLDETLIQGDSSVLWTQYLWDQQIITDPRFVEADKQMMAQYNAGTLDMATYLRFSLQALAGISTSQIDLWLADFVDTMVVPRIYPEGIRTIENYRQHGIPIIVISATVSFIVKKSPNV